MAVPALLLPVDGQVHIHTGRFRPDLLDFFQLNQVIHGTGTIQNIYRAVAVPLVKHIIDDGAQRRKADSSGDKQKILTLQGRLHRK